MRPLKQFIAASTLTLALALTTIAGDMHDGFIQDPPPPPPPGATAPASTSGEEANTDADMTATDSLIETTLEIVESALLLY